MVPNGGAGATARRWRIVLVAAACATVSQAFGRFTYSLLITDVRDDLGLSNTVAGSLGSANLGSYLVGTLVISLVVGRLGLSRTTRLGVSGVTVGLALLAWAPGFGVALLGMVVTGFFGASVWITAPGLATAEIGPARRGTAVGIIGAGIGSGIVISAVLEATIAEGTWRTVYRVEAAVAVVVAAAAVSWLRGGPARSGGPIGLGAIRQVPAWGRVLWAYGVFALAMACSVTFLVATLEEDSGWSSSTSALAFTAFGVGTVCGGPLFGPLSDRFGRSTMTALAFMVMAGTAVVVASGARPWAVVAAFFLGTSFTAVPTIIAAHVSDHVSAEAFGAAFGVATLAFGTGLVIGPQLGGVIGDTADSFRPVFAVVAVSALLGAALSWSAATTERRRPRRQAEELAARG